MESLFERDDGAVWRHFAAICNVPRPSKHEQQISAHLQNRATKNGWQIRHDTVGNLVFAIPGCGTLANAAPLVLQGHMDMVCEKNADTEHDFMNDPIQPRISGDWVTGTGTTLGADNGIALALAMALAEETVTNRIPLELLFTVDEETGLTGAMELDPAIVHGRQLLNLDSEEDEIFTIGCAGGVDMTVAVDNTPCNDAVDVIRIDVRGLRGGHSGVNIHEGRANAIVIALRLIRQLTDAGLRISVHALNGGSKKNAIPRECTAIVSGCTITEAETVVATLMPELTATEPDASIHAQAIDGNAVSYTVPSEILGLAPHIPCGVITMDPTYPDLVQTSNSIGVVSSTAEHTIILLHGRSSSEEAKSEMVRSIEQQSHRSGCRFNANAHYPGWAPNPNSSLLKTSLATYEQVFGKRPAVAAVHAGLEAGIIGDKLGTSELLSLGPTIEDAHSPSERLHITSVGKTYRFLKALVTR